jgi:hypothetical protein
MSIIGPDIRLNHNGRAEQMHPAGEPSPENPPYRLLWSIGIVALVFCVIAFVLWGVYGAGTLFDMMIAMCT